MNPPIGKPQRGVLTGPIAPAAGVRWAQRWSQAHRRQSQGTPYGACRIADDNPGLGLTAYALG